MTEQFNIYNSKKKLSKEEKLNLVDFLINHLDEYGDERVDIKKAIDYSVQDIKSAGGSIILLHSEKNIIGAVVINQTGMGGYIPENILVYIAIHKNKRGEGLGSKLMKKAIEITDGDIALHVEANNPAKHLYKKFGFTNPYLEMRLKK